MPKESKWVENKTYLHSTTSSRHFYWWHCEIFNKISHLEAVDKKTDIIIVKMKIKHSVRTCMKNNLQNWVQTLLSILFMMRW